MKWIAKLLLSIVGVAIAGAFAGIPNIAWWAIVLIIIAAIAYLVQVWRDC
jgi:hypothetical protein